MFARLIAPAALVAMLAAAPAHAQQILPQQPLPATPFPIGTTFCGHFVVDSLYNTVTSNGTGSRVDYMM